jgi:mono/diheme cytochrome c family protein
MKKSLKRQRQQDLQKKKQRQRLLLGAGTVLLLALIVLTAFSLRSGAIPPIDHADTTVVALGQQVYQAQCASCHGANLEGEENWQDRDPSGLIKAPPHDETGHTWHHGDAYLFDSVRQGGTRLSADVGISPMPAYRNVLSDAEIAASLAYIKSTWPSDILAAQVQR